MFSKIRFGTLISGLMLFQTFNLAFSITIPANNPLIEYTGRIDFSDSLAPAFAYSGVSVRAFFQGTRISILLNDEGTSNYFDVIIDKSITSVLQTHSGLYNYEIATGLQDTVHEIEVFKRTELIFGKTKFCGFNLDDGKGLVPISDNRPLLIEFIGNSITCGYGNEGIMGKDVFGPSTENHYLTYAAIASRSFNARHLAVCYSGIGIYRNYGGPAEGNTNCMPNNYQGLFFNTGNPKYNFAKKPDILCIDLGTNDFSTNGGDSAKFVSTYLKFIDTIQIKNSGGDIVCLMGPMMNGSLLDRFRRYMHVIADSANAKNHGSVSFFEMSQQLGDLGYGIDSHPSVAQHIKNARELIDYISQLKDWKIRPLAVYAYTKNVDEIKLSFNTEVVDSSQNFNGFSVYADNALIGIDKIYNDTSDKSKLHLILTRNIEANQKVMITYTPGTVKSLQDVMLEKISGLGVINTFVETATQLVDARSFSIYPNPSGNRVLSYKIKDFSIKKLAVELFDMSGRLIITSFLTNPQGNLDYSNLNIQNGNYILKINTPVEEYKTIIFL
jgi:hypothetical protein